MNTTSRYIHNWSEFDPLHFPKTRFREIRTEVHRFNEEPYISRILKLNENGRLVSEIHAGGWKAYPPGQTPPTPELKKVDRYIYSEENQTVVINTLNMNDQRVSSQQTIQYNHDLIQTIVRFIIKG